ncbi:hypothetical protein OH76DRAFT_138034 [Lentinus brumalis]|uniref:Uncharacterized protein n=1 Tax=Lentinus brumalis TaxID=2498619 RepID=A0A371CPK7_9APHY|nr:hypothetical protein OH76DRAFT_138034 [Polyporus brumalis]
MYCRPLLHLPPCLDPVPRRVLSTRTLPRPKLCRPRTSRSRHRTPQTRSSPLRIPPAVCAIVSGQRQHAPRLREQPVRPLVPTNSPSRTAHASHAYTYTPLHDGTNRFVASERGPTSRRRAISRDITVHQPRDRRSHFKHAQHDLPHHPPRVTLTGREGTRRHLLARPLASAISHLPQDASNRAQTDPDRSP